MIPRIALLVFLLGSGLVSGADYRFSLDGRTLDPGILPVAGTRKGDLVPGDIGRVGPFPFVLGPPGHYQFQFGGVDKTTLICRIDKDPPRCVAVKITESQNHPGRRPVLVNPLAAMTMEERAQIRGILIDTDAADWHEILKTEGLDWHRTALTLDYQYDGQDHRLLPELPSDLRYLSISCEGVTGLKGIDSLRGNNKLHFLDLRLYDQSVDLSSICTNPDLVNLSISGGSLESVNELARLSSIKFLKLRRTENLHSIDFVSAMPELRVFKVDSTAVTDLRPLSGCLQLRLLSASSTLVKHLPDARNLAYLRDVRVLDTPPATRQNEATTLQKARPASTVQVSWEDALRAGLVRADRLSLRTISDQRQRDRHRDSPVEIQGAENVQRLIATMRITPRNSGSYRMSHSDYQLDFYEGERLVATMGLHHGRFLRWHRGRWPGDAELTIPAARSLCDLLAGGGHEDPQRELRQAIARKRARVKNWEPSIRSFEKADQEFPPSKNSILLTGSSSIRKWNLKESFPGKPMINRGFGGSELSDAILYFDRIVLPHRPRVIFLYAGDNDIERGKSAQQVVEDYKAYAQLIRQKIPGTKLGFIAIKPSIKRWHLWPEMALANRTIQSICETEENSYYIDIVSPMLNSEGFLHGDFFAKDNLHLSEKGYQAWTRVLSRWLEEHDPGS